MTVRVYDAAKLDPGAAATALETAAATLATASVDVTWMPCRGSDACRRPMAPGELAIRFVRVTVPRDYKGTLPLGDAMVDPWAKTGVLATIYVDRVEWLAADSGHDAASLLGRTIAHELGHLLLASATHSRHGLMRPVWSREELRAGRRLDWTFTQPDVDTIQTRLRRRR